MAEKVYYSRDFTHQECLYCFRNDAICLICRDLHYCKNNINIKDKEVVKKKIGDAVKKFYIERRCNAESWKKYDTELVVNNSFMLPYGDSPLTDKEKLLVFMVKRVFGEVKYKISLLAKIRRSIVFNLGKQQKIILLGTNRKLKVVVKNKEKNIKRKYLIKPEFLEAKLNKLVKYGILEKKGEEK